MKENGNLAYVYIYIYIYLYNYIYIHIHMHIHIVDSYKGTKGTGVSKSSPSVVGTHAGTGVLRR